MKLPALIVAVATPAGILLAGMPALHQGEWASPASAAGPGPTDTVAIDWQTDRVDLHADGLTLQLGDQTFTTEDAEVSITEVIHTDRYWTLLASWTVDDHAHTLALNFRSNGSVWRVETIAWLASGIALPDGRPGYGVASVGAANPTRTPLGQTLTSDLIRSTEGGIVPCDATEADEESPVSVPVVLAFEGLRLSVAPQERSLLEEVSLFLGLDSPSDEPFDLAERVC